VNQKSGYDQIS